VECGGGPWVEVTLVTSPDLAEVATSTCGFGAAVPETSPPPY
jgi:hypothetical protein